MSKRKLLPENYNSPDWNIEAYDLTRYFIELNSTFPCNTSYIGNNYNEGSICYNTLMENIEECDGEKELLFKSTAYNFGVRKHYLRIDKCILLMESIHFKKSDNFTDNAGYDDENDESLPIVGALTVMHPEEVIPQYINDMIGNSFLKVEEIPTIGIISRDANGFFLSEVKMETKISHELDLHYGEKFEEFHTKLLDKLVTTNKGISLFHGDPGTGKSSYIRKLIYDLKERTNKKVIIVPNNLVGYLVDPEFNSFLIETIESYQYDDDFDMGEDIEEVKGMILIIEDAESVLMKRELNYNNQGTSNLLNLTDGLLNDIFSIQVIATYNTGDENIDDAIKRSKRLIAKRKFKKLPSESAKKLAELIGVSEEDIKKIKSPMVVSDVYALLDIDNEEILIDKDDNKKGVGFDI